MNHLQKEIFPIGELSLIKNQEAKINLDSFLSRHAAVLGQTGGGNLGL